MEGLTDLKYINNIIGINITSGSGSGSTASTGTGAQQIDRIGINIASGSGSGSTASTGTGAQQTDRIGIRNRDHIRLRFSNLSGIRARERTVMKLIKYLSDIISIR